MVRNPNPRFQIRFCSKRALAIGRSWTSRGRAQGRKPVCTGTDVVCLGWFWVRCLAFPNAGHLVRTNALAWYRAPPLKSGSSTSRSVRHSGITVAFKTTLEIFTGAGPDNSLERLTKRGVGLVTDQPSDVCELFVTLL